LTDLFSVLSQSTRLTDRQTDGRTDRRTDSFLIAIPRLHFMQRGKNWCRIASVDMAGSVKNLEPGSMANWGVFVCLAATITITWVEERLSEPTSLVWTKWLGSALYPS